MALRRPSSCLLYTSKNNGQWIKTGRMYEESQWHQVKVKIDLEKKRCTLYVDDMEAPLLEDMQFKMCIRDRPDGVGSQGKPQV